MIERPILIPKEGELLVLNQMVAKTSWQIIDFFNIRWYGTPFDYTKVQWRNLVNGNDEEMSKLQKYLIYAHLLDILWICLPLRENTILQYDRFEGWDPWFCFFTTDDKPDSYDVFDFDDLPGCVFPNGSSANRWAIEYIQKLTWKAMMTSYNAHTSVKSQSWITISPCEQTQGYMEYMRNNTIWWIVATFGTTNFWSNDERIMDTDLLQYCKDNGVLIHIDMAYGWYYLSEAQRLWLRNNYHCIHSIMIDPHKMISDIGCSLLLFPNWFKSNVSKIEYFHGLWTAAWTSLSPMAAYQAKEFLQTYWMQWLRELQWRCMRIAETIAKWFESLGYTLYVSADAMQYPNICVRLEDEKMMNYIIDYFKKRGFMLAKIHDGENYGVRIFVSPVWEFFDHAIIQKFLEFLSEIPYEQFIDLGE